MLIYAKKQTIIISPSKKKNSNNKKNNSKNTKDNLNAQQAMVISQNIDSDKNCQKVKRKISFENDNENPKKKRKLSGNRGIDNTESAINKSLVDKDLTENQCIALEKELGLCDKEQRCLHDNNKRAKFNEWKNNRKNFPHPEQPLNLKQTTLDQYFQKKNE